jgi:hypothetical protein
MNYNIKRVGLLALCIGAVAAQSAQGAEAKPVVTPTVAPTPKPVPAQLDGTIVAVNPRERTVTVDVKGKLLTVNVTKQLKISRNGKVIGFEELAPGQTVNLGFVELPDGHIEVASLAVASNPEGLEAAGAVNSNGKGQEKRRVPTLPPQSPFTTPPNPANVGGRPVSPHN